MENIWTGKNNRTGRVPESVFNGQFIGMKCSGDKCRVLFSSVKDINNDRVFNRSSTIYLAVKESAIQ